MAATRERRSNAGARMTKLIADEEDDDDFYKTTYGGFNEEASDHDFDSDAENSDDVVDSDFSIDENDEIRSDLEDDEPKAKKRRAGVDTKAYKEPKKKTDEEKAKERERAKKRAEEKKDRAAALSVQIYHSPTSVKKSLRRSTAVKSEAAEVRKQEREVRSKMMKDIAARKNVPEVRRLTQEELLTEAKVTEALNKKSLEDYYKQELEKKKSRVTKQVYHGPLIRYHSVSMPLIEELPSPEIEINVVGETENERTLRHSFGKEKCARTFITFTDDKTLDESFPQRKYKVPIKQYCPVTRLPAKYFDPVTQTPYATVQAFKCIRDAYHQHIQVQLEKRKQQQQSNAS